jgi:cytochrome c biogenesis protein CcmG/thiol:disulfide interchange protein DsbE
LICFVVGACYAPPPSPLPTTLVPEIDLVTLDGAPERIARRLGGRVGVVSLWATWCEACVDELAALERLHERAEANRVEVVAVAVGERHEHVADWVTTRGLKIPQLVDEEFRFADALGQRRVPTTLVIDAAGRIRFAGGALDGLALAALRSVLAAPVASR